MENHAAFKRRIKDEGRAEEVELRYHELIAQKYKSTAAWKLVKAEFKPIVLGVKRRSRSKLPSSCKFKMGDFINKPDTSTRKALEWALAHYAIRDVKAPNAPSALAWSYLHEMRQDKTFFQDVLKKCVPSKSEIENGVGAFNDDGRTEFKLIDKLLDEAGKAGNHQ